LNLSTPPISLNIFGRPFVDFDCVYPLLGKLALPIACAY
jgi:hypothetical protein